MRFNNLKSLVAGIADDQYPEELMSKILYDMFQIQKNYCKYYGEDQKESLVEIAETEDEVKEVMERYPFIKNKFPAEIGEHIMVDETEWVHFVFIISDAGEGICVFAPREMWEAQEKG